MKVSGGLIGITLNPTARTKYFLITPELAILAEQAKLMAGTSSKTQTSIPSTTGATGAAVEGRVSLAQIYAAAATTRQEKCVTMST